MGSNAERDAAVHAKAKELIAGDPELKAMAEKSPYPAFKKALAKAAEMIPPGKGGGTGTSSTGLSRDRDDAIRALALKLLRDDPECVRLNRKDESKAFKLALRKASRATADSQGSPAGSGRALTEPALERARQVHKGAMILLSTQSAWRDLAARNYPDAFDKAHSVADGPYGENFLAVPPRLKHGARAEKVHQRALVTLKTALRSRDSYDSLGAFDEAIRDAEVTTPLDGQPSSVRGGWQIDENPPRPPRFVDDKALPLY